MSLLQELGKEFLKGLKAVSTRLSTSSLSLFSVALALSMARIHRFEEAVSQSHDSHMIHSASHMTISLSHDTLTESNDTLYLYM